jgi:hypothetical protein
VKYYNEEDVDKIGPALKRITSWQSHKDSDVGESTLDLRRLELMTTQSSRIRHMTAILS